MRYDLPRLYRAKPGRLTLSGTAEYILVVPMDRHERWVRLVLTRDAYMTGTIANRIPGTDRRVRPGKPLDYRKVPQVLDFLRRFADGKTQCNEPGDNIRYVRPL